jgi:threonylcarbamoyladenosine tRNA methylthiotransferase MtaB
MFASSLDLVEACDLAYVHIFPFSPRKGTPAARMPQVPRGLVKERAARLRSKGAESLARHLARQTGRVVEVLVEQGGRGRARDFAEVAIAPSTAPGTLARVEVSGHDGRRLHGEVRA